MKTLTDVQIIISEDNKVSYNYNGILWTKEQFEEQFLPKSKKFVVIYTDFGDTCDGFARISGIFNSIDEARADMDKDIKFWCQDNDMDREEDVQVDYPDRVLMGDECEFGCQWQILEVDM